MAVSLEDVANILDLNKGTNNRHDKAVYGEVKAINSDKTYQVSLNGSDTTVKCARLSGAKVGDTVLVEILSNGYAVVTGTVGGDTDASDAQQSATAAQTAAGQAQTAASAAQTAAATAETAATNAVTQAEAASAAAQIADSKAAAAQTSADNAATAAATADSKADAASAAATRAEGKADAASAAASRAETAATQAAADARAANESAIGALDSLSTVQDVVGTLNWIAEHGTYALTTDTSVTPGKYYFTRSGAGTDEDPYVYTPVSNPTGNPQSQGYYELTGVDEAVAQYVSTHISLLDDGLYITLDDSGYKLKLTNDGAYITDPQNIQVAKYSNEAIVGKSTAGFVRIAEDGLGLYGGQNVRELFSVKSTNVTADFDVQFTAEINARAPLLNQCIEVPGRGTPNIGTYVNVTVNVTQGEYTYTERFKILDSGDGIVTINITSNASIKVWYYSEGNVFRIYRPEESSSVVYINTITFSYNTTGNAPAFMLGVASAAVGAFSAILGEGLYASQANQIAVGKYNTLDSSKIFSVGNGSSSEARSTAFAIGNDGETNLALPYLTGTSSTAGSTITKVVTASGFTLTEGAIVAVTFTNANTGSVSLNVNGTGSKNAYYNGSRLNASNGNWAAGETVLFRYDGTYYQRIDGTTAGTSYSSVDADLLYALKSLGWTSDVIE